MTTYRPGFAGPRYSKHLRHDKHRDTLFSDEANANTDWLPVRAGDTVIVTAHHATLRRTVRNGAVANNEFDVVRSNMTPRGSITLKHKLGGEDDNHAALLGSWTDIIVTYEQKVYRQGFVRLEFGCMQGQLISEHTDEAGASATPNGMFVSVEVVPGGR